MPEKEQQENKSPEKGEPKKESPMPKDSFLDDLLYVATETTDPLAEPKKDPVPGGGESNA